MNKCKGCGKWWREDDGRMLALDAAPHSFSSYKIKRCKSSGKSVLACCSNRAGDSCYKCNGEN